MFTNIIPSNFFCWWNSLMSNIIKNLSENSFNWKYSCYEIWQYPSNSSSLFTNETQSSFRYTCILIDVFHKLCGTRKFCFNSSTKQYLPQNLLRRPFHFHKNNIWEDITEFNENSVLCYLRNTIFTILINFILMEHNFSSLFFIFKFNKRRIFVY